MTHRSSPQPFFVAGPHGGGKTTLIERLCDVDHSLSEIAFDIDFLREFPNFESMTHYERCFFRLYHRGFVSKVAHQEAIECCPQRVIVSRGILDSLAYARAYRDINWITEEEFDRLSFIGEQYGSTDATVVLNPAPDVVMERLEIRRQAKTRMHRDYVFAVEDSEEFVALLIKHYEELSDRPNVLLLRDNDADSQQRVLEWMSANSAANDAASRVVNLTEVG